MAYGHRERRQPGRGRSAGSAVYSQYMSIPSTARAMKPAPYIPNSLTLHQTRKRPEGVASEGSLDAAGAQEAQCTRST